MKGKVLIFTGDGKGKTTAAMGAALRAKGHGKRVIMIQFLKKGDYGGVKMLREMGVEVYQFGTEQFVFNVTEEDRRRAEDAMKFAREKMKEEPFLLILDEINVALSMGLVETKKVLQLLEDRGGTHIILTGRYAPHELIEKADLVTEMRKIKHYYDEGERALEGLEY